MILGCRDFFTSMDTMIRHWRNGTLTYASRDLACLDVADIILQPTVKQLISSLMTIGTFVSSLLVGPFSSKFGRKTGLWTASVLNFVATAVMLGTTSVGALYAARLILGSYLFDRLRDVWTLLRT